MSGTLHSFVEVWSKENKWTLIESDNPFGWPQYGMFGFLGNERNWSKVSPVAENRGLPKDSPYLERPTGWFSETNRDSIMEGTYGHTWLMLSELLEYDYSKDFEDRRDYDNGRGTLPKGSGEIITVREFLGEDFFRELDRLKRHGKPDKVRITISFS